MTMGREDGFTLLELMLAIGVLGMIMAMISVSLSGSLNVVETANQQEQVYRQAEIAMRRITADLAGAVLLADIPFVGEQKEENDRHYDRLRFASSAHLVLNTEKQPAGLGQIRYYIKIDPEDKERFRLLRSDRLYLPEEDLDEESDADTIAEDAFLLADNLRSLAFTYYDRKGQEFDSWETKVVDEDAEDEEQQYLPAAVKCTLEFWLDTSDERYQAFSTTILLPTGVVVAEEDDDAS